MKVAKACKVCFAITEEDKCPLCGGDTSKDWQGYVVIIEGIVHLAAVLSAAHEAKLAEATQLVGYGRFGHFKLCSEIANVQFPLKKHGDDPQAAWVTESAEKISEMVGSIIF